MVQALCGGGEWTDANDRTNKTYTVLLLLYRNIARRYRWCTPAQLLGSVG